jgi:cold shock CspA family protein
MASSVGLCHVSYLVNRSGGVVRSFDPARRRGLIAPDHGGLDVVAPLRGLVSTERRSLEPGQRVRYDLLPGRCGLEADNIRRA